MLRQCFVSHLREALAYLVRSNQCKLKVFIFVNIPTVFCFYFCFGIATAAAFILTRSAWFQPLCIVALSQFVSIWKCANFIPLSSHVYFHRNFHSMKFNNRLPKYSDKMSLIAWEHSDGIYRQNACKSLLFSQFNAKQLSRIWFAEWSEVLCLFIKCFEQKCEHMKNQIHQKAAKESGGMGWNGMEAMDVERKIGSQTIFLFERVFQQHFM